MRAVIRWPCFGAAPCRRAAPCVAALLFASALGCSGDGGLGAQGGDGAGADGAQAQALQAPMCQLPSGGYGDACNGCLASSCCEPIEACKGDAACAAQLACIVECQHAEDPSACSVACSAADELHSGYLAYDDCSFSACRSTCWM